MNARTVSLPDLVTEKRTNTALSLSEGFAGARHEAALTATKTNWAPRPGAGMAIPGTTEPPPSKLGTILQLYYRTRQMVLAQEKSGHRVPMKLATELRSLEKALASELRPVHPILFQRFDDLQLDRLLRAMPFLRLSAGRWLFGGEVLNAEWPPAKGDRAFLLLSGRISLFPDNTGAGERTEVHRGAVFGEKKFKLGDEGTRDLIAGSAHCEEPSIVGILSTAVLEAAYADRLYGNKRIEQMVRHVPALARIVMSDDAADKVQQEMSQSKGPRMWATVTQQNMKPKGDSDGGSFSVAAALKSLSKVATAVHVRTGQELLSDESFDESVLMVSKGQLEIRADLTLTERLDALPPKPVRLRIHLERAADLAGDSIWDKLDPYVLVKLGDFKRVQTPVLWNVGPNPKFDYHGVLTYGKEEFLDFTVNDYDQYSADDLCGNGSIAISELYDGWRGHIQLTRPKRGIFQSDQTLEEPAGRLYFSVRWDYEKVNALERKPKVRGWENQVLFTLEESDSWGHEQIMMGNMFKRTLEGCTASMKYNLSIDNMKIVGSSAKGGSGVVTCWKASRRRFLDFVKHCGREKQFTQACRVSTLDKQVQLKDMITRLVKKWEQEAEAARLRSGILDGDQEEEKAMDPSMFRVAYRGVKAHISVRNALNLQGGGWFDKLDPYAVVKFKNAKAEFRTSVLQDAGADPTWECHGSLVYQGETSIEIQVWDYDKYSADDLVATGVIQVEQFCQGFEGMVPLSLPGEKKKKSLKQSMIVIGIQWDPPRDPNSQNALANTGTLTSGALANIA